VVCVSHDPRLIGHADRVLRMEDGMLLSDERHAAPLLSAVTERCP